MTAVILRALLSGCVSSFPQHIPQQQRDVSSPSSSAGRDYDQELHQSLVDIASSGRLDDEDIFIADGLSYGERGLLVRVVERDGAGDLDTEPAG